MDSCGCLSITLWNVEGLYGALWKRIIRKWITEKLVAPDFFCLQEIKVDSFRLDVALKTILPDYQAITSLQVLGNGGIAILVYPKMAIKEYSRDMKGQVAWVIVTW